MLLYYSLLEFRYTVLTDSLGIQQNSFDAISDYDMPTDHFLRFYYHFSNPFIPLFISSFTEAEEHYKLAEKILVNIPDEIEHAEFYYRIATFIIIPITCSLLSNTQINREQSFQIMKVMK